MNIYVQVWTEIDPTLNVRVDRHSGDAIAENGDVLRRVCPLGRAAVAAALAMNPTNVTAYSVGSGHRDALQHALAAGASQAAELAAGFDGFAGSEPATSARPSDAAVADWLLHRQPDLVIADRSAGLIAGRLGWSHLAGLDDLQFEDGRLRAVRHLGRGEREVVTARLPAIVRLQTELVRPPYVSRARINAATPKVISCERLKSDEPGSVIGIGRLQPLRPRTRLGRLAQAASSRGVDRLAALVAQSGTRQPASVSQNSAVDKASPEDMAEEFVRYLIHHDLLSLRKEE